MQVLSRRGGKWPASKYGKLDFEEVGGSFQPFHFVKIVGGWIVYFTLLALLGGNATEDANAPIGPCRLHFSRHHASDSWPWPLEWGNRHRLRYLGGQPGIAIAMFTVSIESGALSFLRS